MGVTQLIVHCQVSRVLSFSHSAKTMPMVCFNAKYCTCGNETDLHYTFQIARHILTQVQLPHHDLQLQAEFGFLKQLFVCHQ